MAIIKMDWQKNLLFAAMAAVIFMLIIRYGEFQETYQPPVSSSAPQQQAATTNGTATSSDIPAAPTEPGAEPVAEEIPAGSVASNISISVSTDTLDVVIDPQGGDIVRVALPHYYRKINTPEDPFVLIDNDQGRTYTAQSGLIGPNGTDSQTGGRPLFHSESQHYQLQEGQDSLQVDLTHTQASGARITKRFTFYREKYRVQVEYLIDNQSDEIWRANLYGQIKRDDFEPSASSGAFAMKPFVGPALTTPDDRYRKFSFKDISKNRFETDLQGGWISMVQHYFISAWVPGSETNNKFTLEQSSSGLYLFTFISPRVEVAAGETANLSAQFYAGPKNTNALKEIAPHLDLTVDYGWLWWLAMPLFGVLKYLYSLIGNWGLSIIALTVIIKAIFFRLSATSYRSMAKMRKLAPKMQELKERYGDDRQKMSQATMKLYKDEKVNPLGGCLPMLIQMPVFLALYWVLMESVELRHTPFLWVPDLSTKDPLFILPLLMGFTMWLTMRLSPTPTDPMQARIMQFMPLVFTVMFLWFPAGLVLYWVTNNTLSFLQQLVITRQIERAETKQT